MSEAVETILRKIEDLQQANEHLVIAIDGRCAAGKTTLAAHLQETLSCTVIHMDDFFLRPVQRTQERLNQPGGNVDYERFAEEVFIPLRLRETFSYRPYDCHTQKLTDPIRIMPHPITIVEGSYACHPTLWERYDLHIFLTVEPGEQLRRICMRNGEDCVKRFQEKWIPLEEQYFLIYQIAKRCELCFQT